MFKKIRLEEIKNNQNKYFFVLVLSIALFFRFFLINKVPLSLNWDEVAFGYNAYSILETGKDEYGKSFPLAFKSVGDYKCPLFVYFNVPVIKLLGLNEFSLRFVSSLFGSLSVAVFFLLVLELFGNSKLALTAGLILAISPWHLQFTRAQGDVAISSFFVICGLWLFLKWIKKKYFYLLGFSAVCFSLTFYAYFAERFFTPVLLIFLFVFFKKDLWSKKTDLIKGLVFGFLILLPLFSSLFSSGQKSKILMTTIFGYKRPTEYLEKTRKEDRSEFIFQVFHNPVVEYSLMVADRYLNHFSPYFLFIRGVGDDRQKIEGMGMLYWSDFVLLIFAIFTLIKKKQKRKQLYFVFLWLLISPLPSIITRDPVHARRAFNMIYPLSIFLALGLMGFFEFVKKLSLVKKITFSLLLGGFFAWSFSFYLLSYYIITPLKTYQGPGGWQYGYKQLVEFVSPLKNKYDQVVVDTTYQGPYLFFLFYEKYPPSLYQLQASLVQKDEFSLGESKGYDNYRFRDIYWPDDRGLKNTLFAGPPERLPLKDIDPKNARILKTIYFPDGKIAYYIVETF